jgi:hypothetical protein
MIGPGGRQPQPAPTLVGHFKNDAASRASTGINGELEEETRDLRDEVLSTSIFEGIVGSSEAICGVTSQVKPAAVPRECHRRSEPRRRQQHLPGKRRETV